MGMKLGLSHRLRVILEQDAEENIWTQEGQNNVRLEKTAQ
jgi:hypothetical protein